MENDIQQIIDLVLKSLKDVRTQEFDDAKCSAIAAAALEAQVRLSDLLANAEFQSKQAKNDLEFLFGDKSVSLRLSLENASGKKVTEGQIDSALNKDEDIKQAKLSLAESEKEFKKWQYIFNTLKEAHIFFRNLDKNKSLF